MAAAIHQLDLFDSSEDVWLTDPALAFASWIRTQGSRPGSGRAMAANSVTVYASIWAAWCRHCEQLGTRPAEADDDALRTFIAQPGRRVEHRRRCLRLLDRVFTHLRHLRGRAPAAAPARKDVLEAQHNRSTAFLTPGQRQALMQWLQADAATEEGMRDRALVALALGAGLKTGELVASSVNCVAEDGSWVEVRGVRHRRCHVMPFAIAAVARWRAARSTGPLFPGAEGTASLDDASVFRAVRAALLESGAVGKDDPRCGAQTLRNTHAAMLLEEGLGVELLAQRLGFARRFSAERLAAAHHHWLSTLPPEAVAPGRS